MRDSLKGKGLAEGFTLIEVLVAVIVIAIGFVAAMMMQTRAMEGGARAESQTVAMILAESKIEELSATHQDSLPDELKRGEAQVEPDLNRLGERVAQGGRYTRRTIMRLNCPTRDSNEVEVTVSWAADSPKSLTYVSILPIIKN